MRYDNPEILHPFGFTFSPTGLTFRGFTDLPLSPVTPLHHFLLSLIVILASEDTLNSSAIRLRLCSVRAVSGHWVPAARIQLKQTPLSALRCLVEVVYLFLFLAYSFHTHRLPPHHLRFLLNSSSTDSHTFKSSHITNIL